MPFQTIPDIVVRCNLGKLFECADEMALIGKTAIIGYIYQGVKFSFFKLNKGKFKLADAPVLARGNANILFKDPLESSFIEF